MTRAITESDVITVRIGEMAVAGGDTVLKTLLGSCIGIALYDTRRSIGGLAHVVLPDSSGHRGPAGKFVDTAIPELIRQIEQQGGMRRSLRAKLAGGANMFMTVSTATIGDQNLAAVQRALANQTIAVAAAHCGGCQGRRMIFSPATGRVRIEVVGSESVEI
ncbi:MAG: chemotaxis protein CheD [Planctomycetaceae bacterium]